MASIVLNRTSVLLCQALLYSGALMCKSVSVAHVFFDDFLFASHVLPVVVVVAALVVDVDRRRVNGVRLCVACMYSFAGILLTLR